jgi:hypothetical protein
MAQLKSLHGLKVEGPIGVRGVIERKFQPILAMGSDVPGAPMCRTVHRITSTRRMRLNLDASATVHEAGADQPIVVREERKGSGFRPVEWIDGSVIRRH